MLSEAIRLPLYKNEKENCNSKCGFNDCSIVFDTDTIMA